MDSVSSQLSFHIEDLRHEVDDPSEIWQLLLRINARLCLVVGRRRLLDEPDFPIVELAQQIAEWICDPERSFEYHSLESEESPLLSFISMSGERYLPRSAFALDELDDETVSRADLLPVLETYVRTVRDRVRMELGIDVSAALGTSA
ncbi:hypothetical protein [Luteibacter sp.]|uniref:DUF7878 domain-containing protein n=1 Tax=Luteibacter sp. TaxID=1886636 RepID=UPI0025B9A1F5|nr:hypothetical protein [Luteibacter sp.]